MSYSDESLTPLSTKAAPLPPSLTPVAKGTEHLLKKPAFEAVNAETEAEKPGSTGKLHLDYLDGIRGLSALYVALYHSMTWSRSELTDWPRSERYINFFLGWGHYAVVVFIVLSGYCLTLPVAMSSAQNFRGGLKRYLLRRAWRILPPYYASLVLAMFLLALLPSRETMMAQNMDIRWIQFTPYWQPDIIISRLLLLHNLQPKWAMSLNGPTWTVATEAQLYLFLPILLFAWRKCGLRVMMALGIVFGLICYLLPQIKFAQLWLAVGFTLGSVAAIINFSPHSQNSTWRNSLALYLGRFIMGQLLFAPFWMRDKLPFLRYNPYLKDSLFSVLTASVLIYLGMSLTAPDVYPHGHRIRRFLSSKPLAYLGLVSYSFYLVHAPVMLSLQYFPRLYHWNYEATQLLMAGVGVPLALLIGIGFYFAIERPTLRARN